MQPQGGWIGAGTISQPPKTARIGVTHRPAQEWSRCIEHALHIQVIWLQLDLRGQRLDGKGSRHEGGAVLGRGIPGQAQGLVLRICVVCAGNPSEVLCRSHKAEPAAARPRSTSEIFSVVSDFRSL